MNKIIESGPHIWATEPSVDEILADPIIALILNRDGLSARTVRAHLDRERRRLATRSVQAALSRAA